MFELLLLLLPIAAGCGWYAGFKHRDARDIEVEKNDGISRDYLVGLNYLINEQPDKAVDVFIKMLEVNSDTVETHLALGSLFRRRGEVDRAIRIHQNLIARPQLTEAQHLHALSELGEDYLHAGMLDRAERVFLELIELGGETVSSFFNRLLHIYQQQKDWKQAIMIADKIQSRENIAIPVAYYYCELAERERLNGQVNQAHEYLRQAIAADKDCVRTNILLGRLYLEASAYQDALGTYRKVIEQDPDYISEVITPLAECYHKLGKEEDFIQYLNERLISHPRISIILILSDYIRKQQGDDAVVEFIVKHIQRCLSLRGIAHLVETYLSTADPTTRNKLFLLKEFIDKLLKNKPVYRCIHCGFSGKQLYWQCPSCKRWGVIKPIHGIEGD